MKLPNAEHAFVDIAKVRDYSLNPLHKEGRHKARVFASALGLELSDSEWLCKKLLEAARQHDCVLWKKTEYGQRYLIDFVLSRQEGTAQIRSVWLMRHDEDFPRLVTCYVL